MELKQDLLDWWHKVEKQPKPTESDKDKIDEDALAIIISKAALNVPGVVDMQGGLVDDVAKFMGKEMADRGVSIDFDGRFLNVVLYLVVAYGSNIPELALSVQNRVKRSLQDLTGYEVQYVDVHIENVVEEKHEEIIQGDCPAEFISN